MTNEKKDKIVIGVVVDASEAQDGLKRIEQASQQSAQKIKESFKGAGDGLGSVGAGGEEAAAKVDRSTKSIIGSIQRATAQMESGGKAGSKYYEILANQRGVPLDALRPYIDQLKKVEQAQGSVGVSAAQTAAAMRGVPAQFTDIITSIQGGQAPLTVFLQQGGQLKDMFGGAGNAAKALGGYLVGLINPFTLLAVAAGGLAYGYSQGAKEASEFAKSIILTGNAAGATTNQLIQMTEKLNAAGVGSKGLIAESLNTLVASGKLSSGVLEEATLAAVGAQKILGIAVADTAKEFANLAKAPSAGLLNLVSNYQGLTIEVYRQVKALEDQGRTSEAAILAQSSYAKVLVDQKAAVEDTLGRWERGWDRVKNATAGAIDKILEVGRESSNIEQLMPLLDERRRLTSSKSKLGTSEEDNYNRGVIESELLAINAKIKALAAEEKALILSAAAQDTANKKKIAGAEVEKLLLAAMTKTELKKAAIRNAEVQFAIAGTKEEDRKKILASIEEKYAEKSKKQYDEMALSRQNFAKVAERAGDAEKKLLSDLQRSLVSFKVPDPLKEITLEFQKQSAAFVRVNAGLDEYAAGLEAQNDLAQLEMSLLGESSTARGIIIEQYKIELALQKEIRKIKAEIKDSNDAQILIDKATANAQVEKSQASLKVQQTEWTKFYSDIYSGLSDSLYRGFEAGKGFFKSFWDGIKNLFKTTVLKLAVQGVVTGTLGSLGISQASAAQANPLGNTVSLFNAGKSIFDGFSAASAASSGAFSSFALSSFGQSLGLSSTTAASALAAEAAALTGSTIGASATSGAVLTGAGSAGASVAAAMPYVAAAIAAFQGVKAINGDYRIGGLSADMGALFGIAPRLFGMKEKELGGQTVTGTLGTDNLMRNQSWSQDGGLFRSDRSGVWSYGLKDSTAIQDGKAYVDSASLESDKAILQIINTSYASLKTASIDFAKTLGMNADSIASRSDALNLTLGKTAEENTKAIAEALSVVADSIAVSILPNINGLKKEGETAGSALSRIALNFGTVNSIFKDLNFTLFKSGEAGIKAASSFVDLFGGLENLQAASASYFENFYSEEERLKAGREKLAAELTKAGVGTITTKEGFREAVTNADKTGNNEQLAALLKLNSVFAQLYPSMDKSAEAAEKLRLETDAANLAAQKRQAIESERKALQDELNRLTLTDVQLLALQKEALDESNISLFDSLQAAKQKQAAEALAATAAQADAAAKKQAADELASVNKSVQDQITQLLNAGQSLAQQRANELIGLDATTAALKEQLFALQDQATAAQAAKQSAEALAGANETLQQQLNNMLKAQLPLEKQRELELAGMASSTAEIQKRIYALQDETVAAQTAKQAADALLNINRSLQQQIDNQLKSQLPLAQQRELEVQGMDDSTRALQLRIYALTDEAAAAVAAKQAADELANVNSTVQQQIDQLVNAGLTLEQQRAREITGLDSSTIALKQRLFALQDEAAAATQAAEAKKAAAEKQAQAEQAAQSQYQSWLSELKGAFGRESGVFQDVISQFTDLAKSMKDYAESLSTGPAAMLSPEAQYAADKIKFESISSLAKTGDKDALAQLRGVSDKFLESSRRYNASSAAYFNDLSKVKESAADATIGAYAQVDVAKLQLSMLEKSVSGLSEINESVKTVAQLLSGQFSGSGSAVFNREAGQLSILDGYGANVKEGLANVGGFDSLYEKTVSGDVNATKTLQDQMVRWAQFGLDANTMDKFVGKDSLKKLLELFNLRIEDFRGSALTSWDGKEQKLNFDRNGLFSGTTSYAKIADDLKAMQEAAKLQVSAANKQYIGNDRAPSPPPPKDKNQAEAEEQIRLLKRQNELIAALVNQTASDGNANVNLLAELNKRLKAIESGGSLLEARL